jgi:5-methylcytosine-specific restriction protein A
MPCYQCRHTLCTRLLSTPGYCPLHAYLAPLKKETDKHYDQTRRDPEAKKFYNSRAWKIARASKLAAAPVCERCRRSFATEVHHDIPLSELPADDARRTALDNLRSLCKPCHSRIERDRARKSGMDKL